MNMQILRPIFCNHLRNDRVTLDDGSQEVCTPDHPWLLRDGNYCNAEDLVQGDSIMPLNRKIDRKGYEQIQHPGHRKWHPTHRVVLRSVPTMRSEADVIYTEHGKGSAVVHHQDFDKLNNEPPNLLVMEKQDHLDLHEVVRVEFLEDRIDTGDITVENYHNFALSSGVFVHNSTLVSQDIRFARSIKRIQRAYKHGATWLCKIHLALRGEEVTDQATGEDKP